MSKKDPGWIGVDLDGTLAYYEYGQAWGGPTKIGDPIPAMVERVQAWRAQGREVRVFTARVAETDPDELFLIIEAIEEWCVEHIGEALPVTNMKDYNMIELWDDRAVQVVANTGRPVGYSTRGL